MKLGKLGSPSLLQGTQRNSSKLDKVVVVCEDLELGAQKAVAKLLGDCPLKDEEFQLYARVVGLVLFCGMQSSTCEG